MFWVFPTKKNVFSYSCESWFWHRDLGSEVFQHRNPGSEKERWDCKPLFNPFQFVKKLPILMGLKKSDALVGRVNTFII
jgi:hypothetical protein